MGGLVLMVSVKEYTTFSVSDFTPAGRYEFTCKLQLTTVVRFL